MIYAWLGRFILAFNIGYWPVKLATGSPIAGIFVGWIVFGAVVALKAINTQDYGKIEQQRWDDRK